jgi:hypothetical protein
MPGKKRVLLLEHILENPAGRVGAILLPKRAIRIRFTKALQVTSKLFNGMRIASSCPRALSH